LVSDLGGRETVAESRVKTHDFTIEMSTNSVEMWGKLKYTNLD